MKREHHQYLFVASYFLKISHAPQFEQYAFRCHLKDLLELLYLSNKHVIVLPFGKRCGCFHAIHLSNPILSCSCRPWQRCQVNLPKTHT